MIKSTVNLKIKILSSMIHAKPSCCFKLLWLSFFCGAQRKTLCRMTACVEKDSMSVNGDIFYCLHRGKKSYRFGTEWVNNERILRGNDPFKFISSLHKCSGIIRQHFWALYAYAVFKSTSSADSEHTYEVQKRCTCFETPGSSSKFHYKGYKIQMHQVFIWVQR